jgi:hypothetical protein
MSVSEKETRSENPIRDSIGSYRSRAPPLPSRSDDARRSHRQIDPSVAWRREIESKRRQVLSKSPYSIGCPVAGILLMWVKSRLFIPISTWIIQSKIIISIIFRYSCLHFDRPFPTEYLRPQRVVYLLIVSIGIRHPGIRHQLPRTVTSSRS